MFSVILLIFCPDLAQTEHLTSEQNCIIAMCCCCYFTEKLRNHFSKWGHVVDVEVKRGYDKRSRGFGFVLFQDAEGCAKVGRTSVSYSQ